LADSVPLLQLGLVGPEGDVIAARTFADRLLGSVAGPQDRRDARILLTAVCLFLTTETGPAPTAADLVHTLETLEDLADLVGGNPQQFLDYARAEWLGWAPAERRLALGLARSAATRASNEKCVKPA
jgi:hypothetical protein